MYMWHACMHECIQLMNVFSFAFCSHPFSLLMKVAKQVRVNLPQRDYSTDSFLQLPPRKNQIKGFV